MKTLTLWLQKSSDHADVSELGTLVEHVTRKLKYLVTKDHSDKHSFQKSELEQLNFRRDVFNEKMKVIENQVESLPSSSRLRTSSQVDAVSDPFKKFQTDVFNPFVTEVANSIEQEIKVDPVTKAFQCLDVRKFPLEKDDLREFGKGDLSVLKDHFGEPQEAKNPSTLRKNRADPKIDKNAIEYEYEIFKEAAYDIYEKRKFKIELRIESVSKLIKTTLQTVNNRTKISKLKAEVLELQTQLHDMALSELMASFNMAHRQLFPNIIILLELAIICPISNATVERLFSFLKLVKTKLRNQIGDDTLDKVLRIKTESPEHLEDADLEALVDSFKEYAKNLSKSGNIRINI